MKRAASSVESVKLVDIVPRESVSTIYDGWLGDFWTAVMTEQVGSHQLQVALPT